MQQTQLYSKSNIIVFLAAGIVLLAATGMQAQRRPLDVAISVLNSVDLCDADSTFIVTVDLGSLSVADSMNLYDVSLRFPTDRVRFSQVLFQNTLSENLETKDYGSRASGEIRVFGFNVLKPIVGSKPLFAVQFKYVGSCTDSTQIGFASLPDMNPEAKVYIRSLTEAVVPLHIVDKSTRSLKFKFSNDTIVFSSSVEKRDVECRAQLNTGANIRTAQFTFQYDTSLVSLESLRSVHDTDSLTSEQRSDGLRVQVVSRATAFLADGFGIASTMRVQKELTSKTAVRVALISKDTCACITRHTSDTLQISTQFPNDVDDLNTGNKRSEPLSVKSYSDVWELRSNSHSLCEVRLYNVLGIELTRLIISEAESVFLERRSYQPGLYILQATTVTGVNSQKKIFN